MKLDYKLIHELFEMNVIIMIGCITVELIYTNRVSIGWIFFPLVATPIHYWGYKNIKWIQR